MVGSRDVPSRSDGARAALDVFYDEFNDVNFYVEDDDQENFYYLIISKYFPDVSVSKIFPLGGKMQVIKHSQKYAGDETKIRIYIVDKDFDDLLDQVVILDNLFYLELFAIENYVMEKQALIEVTVETSPKNGVAEITKRLNLDVVMDQIQKDVFEIFAFFYFVQKFNIDVKNTSERPEKFCMANQRWKLDHAALEKYRLRINKRSRALRKTEISRGAIADLIPEYMGSDTDAVTCGKFSLLMIFHYMKSRYSFGSITFGSFVYRVAKNCELGGIAATMQKIQRHIDDVRV